MSIDESMAKFAAIPSAEVGRGPKHPTKPDASSAQRIAQFLEAYPALRADAGYVEFLEKYAGASIENEDFSQIVDILGFSDASTDIEEMDGPIVNTDGFLVVVDAIYQLRDGDKTIDTLEHAFAYSVTGDRRQGIYHSLVSNEQPEPAFTYAFDSFESLLADIVAREGWLDPPGQP